MLRTLKVCVWALTILLAGHAAAGQRSNDANVQGAIDRRNADNARRDQIRREDNLRRTSTSSPSNNPYAYKVLCENGQWMNSRTDCPKSSEERRAEERRRQENEAINQRIKAEQPERDRQRAKEAVARQQAEMQRVWAELARHGQETEATRRLHAELKQRWQQRSGLPSDGLWLLHDFERLAADRRAKGYRVMEANYLVGVLHFELAEEWRLRRDWAAARANLAEAVRLLLWSSIGTQENDYKDVNTAAQEMVEFIVAKRGPYRELLPKDFDEKMWKEFKPLMLRTGVSAGALHYDLEARRAAISAAIAQRTGGDAAASAAASLEAALPPQPCVLSPILTRRLGNSPAQRAERLAMQSVNFKDEGELVRGNGCLREALDILPGVTDPDYSNLADKEVAYALGRLGRHAEAVGLFERAFSTQPPQDIRAWMYLRMAESQIELGRLDDARRSLDLAEAADPNRWLTAQSSAVRKQLGLSGRSEPAPPPTRAPE